MTADQDFSWAPASREGERQRIAVAQERGRLFERIEHQLREARLREVELAALEVVIAALDKAIGRMG